MLRISLAMLLLWTCAAGAGGIYRWVNNDGRITYSDQPPPSRTAGNRVELEKLPKLQVVPALQVPADPPKSKRDDEANSAYKRFAIIHPLANSAVRANNGDVAITLELQPELSISAGHSVHLYLDSAQIAQGAQTRFQLTNIDRGTHTIRAEVKNREGHVLISTNTLSFTLQRYSRLF